jgi:hypothetical protein
VTWLRAKYVFFYAIGFLIGCVLVPFCIWFISPRAGIRILLESYRASFIEEACRYHPVREVQRATRPLFG